MSKTIPFRFRFNRESINVRTYGIFRKKISVFIIKAGSHDMRFGLQCRQNFFRIFMVIKGKRSSTIGRNNFSESRKFLYSRLPERIQLIDKECYARYKQHYPTDEKNHSHKFLLYRYV